MRCVGGRGIGPRFLDATRLSFSLPGELVRPGPHRGRTGAEPGRLRHLFPRQLCSFDGGRTGRRIPGVAPLVLGGRKVLRIEQSAAHVAASV